MTTITDDYGRKVVFDGELLVSDTTDTPDRRKPQWVDLDIWRTNGGSYVVKRAGRYRLVHTREDCSRAEGYALTRATATFPCASCNPGGALTGWVQEARVTVEVYTKPQDLIDSMKVDGRYSRFSRSVLAELSDQDEDIDKLWNTVTIP